MRHYFLSIVSLFFLLTSSSVVADGPDLSGMASLLEAQNDYRRTVLEARLAESEIRLNQAKEVLSYSEATLNYAEAELARAKVAHLQIFMQALSSELNRVLHEQANVNRKVRELTIQSELCAGLALGDTSYGAFQCLRYFRRHVVPFALQKEALFKKIEKLPPDEFISNDGFADTKAFAGGNVGKLIQFLEEENYSVQAYGTAHEVVMDFLDAILTETNKKIQEYYRYMDGIRAGTLNVFELPNA